MDAGWRLLLDAAPLMALRQQAYLAAFAGSLVVAWQLTPLRLRVAPVRQLNGP